MPKDASLDEFVDGESADRSSGSDDRDRDSGEERSSGATGPDGAIGADDTSRVDGAHGGVEAATAEVRSRNDAVVPAAPTYQWVPGRLTCDRCGESTKRRWDVEGSLVCPDCKEW